MSPEVHEFINQQLAMRDRLHQDDLKGQLADIGRALCAYHDDFQQSQDESMDLELGEIYREQLRNIFKVLERQGVKFER